MQRTAGFGLACLAFVASAGVAVAGVRPGSAEYYEQQVVFALMGLCCITSPFTLTVAALLVYRWINPNPDDPSGR